MSTTPKYVYAFGGGKADGRADMKDLLGGKGANLAEMSSIGIPVPPGFTITTEVCQDYYAADRKLPEAVKPQVEAALAHGASHVGFIFFPASPRNVAPDLAGRLRQAARRPLVRPCRALRGARLRTAGSRRA